MFYIANAFTYFYFYQYFYTFISTFIKISQQLWYKKSSIDLDLENFENFETGERFYAKGHD